jgi:DNA-binding CsgD family transcriptional regulator
LVRQEKFKDKDFEDTAKVFFDTSPEFYQILHKKAAPNKLTSLDLKYCAYIYSRKSNKDIADILNVDYLSVKNHKTRLKRKLNLSVAENLDFFIQNITL